MPYIKATRVDLIAADIRKATDPGDWNFLYTKEYVRMWAAAPGYATFHAISRTIERPELEPEVQKLTRQLGLLTKATDLYTARREAVAEFRRRVMADYEDEKSSGSDRTDPYKEIGR